MASKKTAAIEAGFDYQYFWFWNYAVQMLSHNSNIKSVEFEKQDLSPVDDVVVHYWDNIVSTTPLKKYNRDFLQCKFKVDKGTSLSFKKLLDKKFFKNAESFFLRAYKFYLEEKQKDSNFRLILCSSANFESSDAVYISNNEGEILLGKLMPQVLEEIKQHLETFISAISLDEVKSFLAHFRFYTAEIHDRVAVNLKSICNIVGVKYDRSKRVEPFSSLTKHLNKQGNTQLDRKSIIEIFRKEELLTDDLYCQIWDSRFFELKTKYFLEKQNKETGKQNNYAFVANEYNSQVAQKESSLIKLKELAKVISTVGLDIEQARVINLAKEGKWSEFVITFSDKKIEEIFIDTKREQEGLLNLSKSIEEETKRLHQIWENKLDILFLDISHKISMASKKEDFDEIEKKYNNAISYAEDNNLSKEIIFEYAKYLLENSEEEKALKYAVDYLKYVDIGKSLIRAEASIFAVILLNRLESDDNKIYAYWREAIELLAKYFDNHYKEANEAEQNKFISIFHKFLLNSAEYISLNKNFSGYGDKFDIEKISGNYNNLLRLCHKIVDDLEIPFRLPKEIPADIVESIKTRLYNARENRGESENIFENHDAEAMLEEMNQDLELFIGGLPTKHLVVYHLEPPQQTEQLLNYAYFISQKFYKDNNDAHWLELYAYSCEALGNYIGYGNCKMAYIFLSRSLEKYEILYSMHSTLSTSRMIGRLKQHIGDTLLYQDIKNEKNDNIDKIIELLDEAKNIFFEINSIMPKFIAPSIILNYSIRAKTYEKYADIENKIDKREYFALIELSNYASENGYFDGENYLDIRTINSIIVALQRLWYLGKIVEIKEVKENAEIAKKATFSILEKYVRKYPKEFLIELYRTQHNFIVELMAEGNFEEAIKKIPAEANSLIRMIELDCFEQFEAAEAFFKAISNIDWGKNDDKINDNLVQKYRKTCKQALKDIIEVYRKINDAVRHIPHEFRGENLPFRSQREEKVIDKFETILFRAVKILSNLMKESSEEEELAEIYEFVIKNYMINLNIMGSFYNFYKPKETRLAQEYSIANNNSLQVQRIELAILIENLKSLENGRLIWARGKRRFIHT